MGRLLREVWTEDFRTWLMNTPLEKLNKLFFWGKVWRTAISLRWRTGLACLQPDAMARLQTQVTLPCWRRATRKPEKGGKRLHALFLSSKWKNVLILQQKVQKLFFFSFQTAISLLLWAGCYRHKETPLLLHLSLCPASASGNVIMKLVKAWDLLELIRLSGGRRRQPTKIFHKKTTLVNVKETRENRYPPHPLKKHSQKIWHNRKDRSPYGQVWDKLKTVESKFPQITNKFCKAKLQINCLY